RLREAERTRTQARPALRRRREFAVGDPSLKPVLGASGLPAHVDHDIVKKRVVSDRGGKPPVIAQQSPPRQVLRSNAESGARRNRGGGPAMGDSRERGPCQ